MGETRLTRLPHVSCRPATGQLHVPYRRNTGAQALFHLDFEVAPSGVYISIAYLDDMRLGGMRGGASSLTGCLVPAGGSVVLAYLPRIALLKDVPR